MAFNFGSSSQSSFGTTANKPTGFATPFGAASTTSAGGFGFGSSTFGQPQQSAPAFGSTFGAPPTSAPPAFGATAFGQPAASVAPTFGQTASGASTFGQLAGAATAFGQPSAGATAFGQPAASAAPTFGSTFGQPAASTGSVFGVGFGAQPQQQSTGLFGASATTKPNLFGTPATSAPTLFGTTTTNAPNLFGNTQATPAPSLFGTNATATPLFGATTNPTQPSLFGSSIFGQTTTSTAPSLFGSNPAQPSAAGGLFGSTFSSNTTSGAGGFGGFGAGIGSTFGGFGTSTGTTGLFGAKVGLPGAQAQQQPPVSKHQLVINSVYAINVFNDERDDVLKKWNMLQACWGTGKGYYNSQQPPVEYGPQNAFYRFESIGYNVIPEADNSEGIVKLVFNKKLAELKNQQDVLKNGLAGILGNRPNLTIEIPLIKALSTTQTEVKLTVSEKGVTGSSRKIPATDLAAFLNQPTQKQQLSTVGVTSITPFVTPSKAELEEYLKQTPTGIDAQMWQAAIQDNPNPRKYIPVPVNGFADLKSRMVNQEYQTGLHQAFLEKVNKDITELKTKHAASLAQITELKQKFLDLQHRTLRVLVKQESTRKVGLAIQPEEELLRGRLESMHTQLNMPKQYKGQINELLSHVKMLESAQKHSENYRVDADAQEEIKHFLKMEQNGISQLISIINGDMEALKTITEGLNEMQQRRQIS